MADKKKKQNGKKQQTKISKIKKAEDLKNPKLPKGNKIPKGADRTLISNEGNIIMTYTFGDISGKKKVTSKTASGAKKPAKQTKAKAKPATKPAAKKTAKKTASKRTAKATKSTKPKATTKQTKKAEKKLKAVKEEKQKVKALKPDRDFENSTDGDSKVIVIGKKSQKKASGGKKLKRVANLGGFTAWDGRTGKTFATKKEALDYSIDVLKRTGEIIPVTRTQRTVTHTFKAESKADK